MSEVATNHRIARRARLGCLALALVGVLAVCGTSHPRVTADPDISTPGVATTQANAQPVIETFVAQPATVQFGSSAVLIWRVNDPDAELEIDNGVGPVSGSSTTVTPSATTVYTLTATNAAGTTTAQLTVTIGDTVTTAPRSTTVTIAPPATGTGSVAVGGAAWLNVTGSLADTPSECGNLSFVSAQPTQDVLIAGVAVSGLWANTNGATTTWTALGTGAGSAKIDGHATSIVYDTGHDGAWWVSTELNGGGVFKTVDDGTTFTRLGTVADSAALSVDLGDPNRATMLSGGRLPSTLNRSTDGGATWTNVGAALPAAAGVAFVLVLDATTYVVGTVNGAASGIYRTTDGGTTWEQTASGGVSGQPLVARDGSIDWVMNGADLVSSVDQGATWTTVTTATLSSGSLLQLPDGRLVSVIAAHVATSIDQGASWRQLGPALPFAESGIAYAAARGAFYAWRSDCDLTRPNPVPASAILRFDAG